MAADLDSSAIYTAFGVPRSDGAYEGQHFAYLKALGAQRPFVLFAFAPKAAGTFLRQAAIDAIDGYLFRGTHAQGGRDGVPYAPSFIFACLDRDNQRPVAHLHMQALPANRHFIEAFGLKPVIMIRNIADMLASYWDMLEHDIVARHEGLNCNIPPDFQAMSRSAKADFMIDIVAPWYASYFATWKAYRDATPETVFVLHYDDFCAQPGESLHAALIHSGHVVTRAKCDAALAKVWTLKETLRFNHGVSGRGRDYFSAGQRDRLARQLSHYKGLEPWIPELTGAGDILALPAGRPAAA